MILIILYTVLRIPFAHCLQNGNLPFYKFIGIEIAYIIGSNDIDIQTKGENDGYYTINDC